MQQTEKLVWLMKIWDMTKISKIVQANYKKLQKHIKRLQKPQKQSMHKYAAVTLHLLDITHSQAVWLATHWKY